MEWATVVLSEYPFGARKIRPKFRVGVHAQHQRVFLGGIHRDATGVNAESCRRAIAHTDIETSLRERIHSRRRKCSGSSCAVAFTPNATASAAEAGRAPR